MCLQVFAHPQTDVDATLRVAADMDSRTLSRLSKVINCA